jgi:muramoyltetrapeptide carboxypeptidase
MTEFIKPAALKTGDKIAIVAPSGVVERDYIDKTSRILKNWGLKVVCGENLFEQHYQFAGSDAQRLADLQNAFDSEDIKAILCARGGYGIMRIIDQLHWYKFMQSPKWIAGFSDITALHAAIQNKGFQSIHSIMPINIGKLSESAKPIELLGSAMFKGKLEYAIDAHSLNRNGTEKAILIGGNLSLLYALSGTAFDFNWEGKILFIEDVGEQYYHIDRIMQSFRLAGKLDKLSGLIIGSLSEMSDSKSPFGRNPEEIIADVVQGFNFPVAFGFPAGHIPKNFPLILGSEVSLAVSSTAVSIKM